MNKEEEHIPPCGECEKGEPCWVEMVTLESEELDQTNLG